jgi:hypothetical protein
LLTDTDLDHLATYAPAEAWALSQAREAARAAAVRPAAAPAPARTWTADEVYDLYERGKQDHWKGLGRDEWAALLRPAPFFTLFSALDRIAEGFKAMNEKNKERNARLDALESRPQMQYRGVWTAAEPYSLGDCVTRSGSLWISKLNHNGATPGESPIAWQLAVKRGADGKDLR